VAIDITSKSLQLGRRIRNIGRLAHITNVFARHGLWSVAERLGISSWLTPEQVKQAQEINREHSSGSENADGEFPEDLAGELSSDIRGLPSRLRRSFEELGPAFVKFGQVLATRQDILPEEFIEELGRLHTSVTTLPFATIKQVLTEELGEIQLRQFKEIVEKPLAAGSIAQVHEATLVTGEKVIVKVQRPGIHQIIKVDLSLMEELARLMEKFIPETRNARPVAMMQEFSRAFLGELDFIREAGNITKLTRNFRDMPEIMFPKVYWELTTPRVMTQSRLDGLPAWDRTRIVAAGIDTSVLVERGLGMFMKMVFIDGLYHGDLHPGNLLAMPEAKVGVIDFGLCVHMPKSTREHLAGLLIALIEEDFSRVVSHYVELAEPSPEFDADAFEYEIGNVVAPFIGLSLKDLNSGRLFWDLARVAAKHGAPMAQDLVIFIKTLASFEGIGSHLDPGFDVLRTAEKYTGDIVRKLYSPENVKSQSLIIARDIAHLAKFAPPQLRRLLKAALDGSLRLNIDSEELDRLTVSLDRSSARMSISIIIASLIVGSSIITFSRVGQEVSSIPMIGLIGFALAGFLGMYVVFSILRGK
jgi:ubiquinone biosynthesis protein